MPLCRAKCEWCGPAAGQLVMPSQVVTMTTNDQGGDVVELRKPAKRGQHPNSLAQLKQYSGVSHTHRGSSETAIRPLSTVYLAELQTDFPDESERWWKLQAR